MTTLDERPVAVDLPAAEFIGVFEPGSSEWHAARADGIGGSEIAGVLGISPWESAFSLWHRKRGHVPPRMANTEMDAGRRLEPVICDAFAERHPEFRMATTGTFRNRERPWQIANPDRLLFDVLSPGTGPHAVLEVKFALNGEQWGSEESGRVPDHYVSQALWYLDTLGLSRCYLMVFIGALGEFREYVINSAVPDDIRLMRDAGAEFMRQVNENIRPKIDGHEQTLNAVKVLPEGMVDLDVQIWPLLRDQYFDALDAFKAAEEEKRRAQALVLDQIGDGHRALCGRERVATRTVRDGKTYSLQPARNRGIAA